MAEAPRRGISEIISRGADLVHRMVKNPLQREGFDSTVNWYGGNIDLVDGKTVFDTRFVRFPDVVTRFVSMTVDVKGDKFLRTYDDHFAKNPWGMLMRHPEWFMEFAFRAVSPRYRGTKEQIMENVERLGLTDYYKLHPWGIEILQPDIFRKGFTLQDILRKDEIIKKAKAENKPGAEVLENIDPIQALTAATKHIKETHDKFGPAGDIVGDIIFREKDEEGVVGKPVLNLPDIILAPNPARLNSIVRMIYRQRLKEKVSFGGSPYFTVAEEAEVHKQAVIKAQQLIAREQKATDVLEHMVYVGFEVARQHGTVKDVGEYMRTIIESYGDQDVLNIVKRFLRRGRPTLPGDGALRQFFMQHNKKHLSADRENADLVRNVAIEELASYLPRSNSIAA